MEVDLNKQYILSLLEKKGISKADFATRMGIARQNLDAMLESKKKDINAVIKMSEILQIPFMEFIGLQPEEKSIYGVLYVNGKPIIVNNREQIEKLL